MQSGYITTKKKKLHIRKQFVKRFGFRPNFDKPKTFNEKMQWLKLHYRNRLMVVGADKLAARRYVKSRAGPDILTKLYGVYSRSEQIDFDHLPSSFVLKTNNSSGTNIICKNKEDLDITDTKEKLEEWLNIKKGHYHYSYEWAYKNIKPKILCEEFLEEKKYNDLRDYRFMCFHGRAELIYVSSNRQVDLRMDFFDLEWNHLPIKKGRENSDVPIDPPQNLEYMIDIAEKLAKPFPFVRVDFFEIGDRVVFGELTFYPSSGLQPILPIEWDYKLGSMLKLPRKSWRTLI